MHLLIEAVAKFSFLKRRRIIYALLNIVKIVITPYSYMQEFLECKILIL